MYIEQNSITNTIYNLLYHDQFAMSGSGERCNSICVIVATQ